jgi:hypothetical protein
MIIYIENIKYATKTTVRMNRLNKVARYNVNTQISVVLPYMNNKLSEKEIPFKTEVQNIQNTKNLLQFKY